MLSELVYLTQSLVSVRYGYIQSILSVSVTWPALGAVYFSWSTTTFVHQVHTKALVFKPQRPILIRTYRGTLLNGVTPLGIVGLSNHRQNQYKKNQSNTRVALHDCRNSVCKLKKKSKQFKNNSSLHDSSK